MTTTTVSGQSFIRTLRHYLETNKNKLSTNYHNKNNNNNNTSIPASLLPFNNHNNKKLAASNNGFPYMSLLAVTSSVNTSASLDNIPYMPQSSSFSLDIHYLYFLYVHFEELGLNIDHSLLGTLPATDAIVFTDHVVDDDMGKASSILSVGSVSSTMSTLSLGSGWQFWKKQNLQQEQNNKNGRLTTPTTLQEDLVIIHQHLSTLSALKLHMHVIIQSDNGQPRSGKRAIRGYEQPLSQQGDVILSLIPFDQLSFLELDHIHPRLIDGWQHFGSNLISLVIKRAGIEDANEVLNLLKANNHHHNREDEIGEEQGIEINKKGSHQHEQKRNRLQMLSLQDNNLTTLEREPLQLIQSLTHLNLSSNLLIDVPSALSALYNLYSLNLSYNMISFVNGINAILGNIQELNLRGNRLTSIVGLDRLWALERLDIRNNRIEDITETNRLLSLPNLEDIWVSGNPFAENNPNYRIDIFNEFYHHQLEIRIDGTGPSFTEKLQLKTIPAHCHGHDTTPLATSLSNTPVPNFEHQCQQNNDNNNINTNNNDNDNIPNENFTSSTISSSVSPPPLQPSNIARAKSKKTKRIIRLRQDNPLPSMEDNEPLSPTSSHVLRYADLQDAVRPSLTRRKSNASRKSTTSSVHRRKKSPLPRSTSPTPPLPLSLSNSNRTQDELSNGERNSNNSGYDGSSNNKSSNNEVEEEEEERNEEKGNNNDKGDQDSNGQRSRLSAQEAFRRKIELMRKEAGTGWLRVLQEMDTVKDGKIKDIPTME